MDHYLRKLKMTLWAFEPISIQHFIFFLSRCSSLSSSFFIVSFHFYHKYSYRIIIFKVLALTLDSLIGRHGRLFFTKKKSTLDTLIRAWTLINSWRKFIIRPKLSLKHIKKHIFIPIKFWKFQGGRLLHSERLLIRTNFPGWTLIPDCPSIRESRVS